jgi:GT2 family glycosyltransferase
MVAREFPWVSLLPQSENVGFPRGNNIALRRAKGRHVLLLNPDTVILADALQQMVAFLDSHPGIAVVGPRLTYPDGTIQSSRRRFPTLLTAFFESTWLEPWAPPGLIRSYRALDLPEGETADVDWVMGAAMMVRRSAIEQAGLMDEAYFMYSEELDWCRRIKEAGWRIVYYPAAEIVHHEGKSSEQAVTARHVNFQRAKLRYFRKYHGRLACTLLRAFLLASYLAQLLLEGAKGLLGHKRPLRRQRIAAYWQVLRSGLRPAGY